MLAPAAESAPVPLTATTDRRIPVVVIAAANEPPGDARFLRGLAAEITAIRAALAEAEAAGICHVVVVEHATPAAILAAFRDEACRDRVAILHYAGHAGPEGLLLQSADGGNTVADAEGLAAFLGVQRALELVVLNACATDAHVEALTRAGVGAVVATSRAVADDVARDFAAELFASLGAGAGIQRAFDEAQAAVRFGRGAAAAGATAESLHASAAAADAAADAAAPVTRGFGRDTALGEDGRWPWALHYRDGAGRALAPWTLPAAAGDPLYGLPKLPPSDAVFDSPFRHLLRYERRHAPLFFGRGSDVRALYDLVTAAGAAPVIMLHGASGVGKSSLLDAGLLPRLTTTHDPRYARRDAGLGLLGTLERALGLPAGAGASDDAAARARALADAWRAAERTAGRPLLVVLDQLEEALTAPRAASGDVAGARDGERELDALARALAAAFGDEVTRPAGRLVLAFRKEWHAEIERALAAHRVPRREWRLDPLSTSGVEEAVRGPAALPPGALARPLEVEPGLAASLAAELVGGRAAHVAPLLQVLLAGMWVEASAASADGPVRFDARIHERVQNRATELDAFLGAQLARLRAWHAPAVDGGLALDYLEWHTTAIGTAAEHSQEEERGAFPMLGGPADPAPGLRAMCVELFLLTGPGDDPARGGPLRLAHDTLAPLVRRRWDLSDAPGQRARRALDAVPPDDVLPEAALALVERSRGDLRALSPADDALVARSRVAHDERRGQRRRQTWTVWALVAVVAVVAGVASLLQRGAAARQAGLDSVALAARSMAMRLTSPSFAVLAALAALERSETPQAREALAGALARTRGFHMGLPLAPSGLAGIGGNARELLAEDERGQLVAWDLDARVPGDTLLTRAEAEEMLRADERFGRLVGVRTLAAVNGRAGIVATRRSAGSEVVTIVSLLPFLRRTGGADVAPARLTMYDHLREEGDGPGREVPDPSLRAALDDEGFWLALYGVAEPLDMAESPLPPLLFQVDELLDGGDITLPDTLAGPGNYGALAMSRQSRRSAACHAGGVVVWDLTLAYEGGTRRVDGTLLPASGGATACAIGFAGEDVVIAAFAGERSAGSVTVRAWDLSAAEPRVLTGARAALGASRAAHGALQRLAIAPDGRFIALGFADGTVERRSLALGAPDDGLVAEPGEESGGEPGETSNTLGEAEPVPGVAGAMHALDFSRDGRWLVARSTVAAQGASGQWAVVTAPGPGPTSTAPSTARYAEASPDGRWLALYLRSPDRIAIAHARTGDTLGTASAGPLAAVAFAPGGAWAVARWRDSLVLRWRLAPGALRLAAPDTIRAAGAAVGRGILVVSDDGAPRWVARGAWGELVVADAGGARTAAVRTSGAVEVSRIGTGAGGTVDTVAWVAPSAYDVGALGEGVLALGSTQGVVTVWDTELREVVATLPPPLDAADAPFTHAAVSVRGGWVRVARTRALAGRVLVFVDSVPATEAGRVADACRRAAWSRIRAQWASVMGATPFPARCGAAGAAPPVPASAGAARGLARRAEALAGLMREPTELARFRLDRQPPVGSPPPAMIADPAPPDSGATPPPARPR